MNTKIKKRDGRLVKFNADKITNAIAKACAATGEFDMKEARKTDHQGAQSCGAALQR